MDGKKIFKTFLKIAGWIAGFVIIPILTALGLNKTLGWDFKTILFYFGVFYVACFLIAFLTNLLDDHIKKKIYSVLEEEELLKKPKRKKK